MIETLTINELFSGIGSQVKALDRLNINYKTVGICEIDKYAIQSYEAINGPTRNYGDISKAERLDYADLWTYSFPCQDLSVAGKQKGINEGTRSGLLYEVQRLLEVAKKEGSLPKYLLLENVKNLVGKKFKPDFEKWLNFLDDLGYMNYWQVLNAKDYGIPQNRERVFVVSIRKDLKQGYIFPDKQELNIKLKDILENNVDEKYYLSEQVVNTFINRSINKSIEGAGFRFKPHNPTNANTAFAITTRAGGRMDDNFIFDKDISNDEYVEFNKDFINEPLIAASHGRNPDNPSDRTVGAPTEQRLEINYNGVSNTLTSVQKDNYVIEPLKIIDNTKKGYTEANEYDSINLEQPNSKTRRGNNICGALRTIDACGDKRVVELKSKNKRLKSLAEKTNFEQGKILNMDLYNQTTNENISQCLTEPHHNSQRIFDGYCIRKLTPLECWRLMGFDDEDCIKAQNIGISNTQLYKQAGNSIVVNVLEAIFKNLFIDVTELKEETKQFELF